MTQKETAAPQQRGATPVMRHTVRCAVCGCWVDIDDIVWRGQFQTIPICTDCEPEGDDGR